MSYHKKKNQQMVMVRNAMERSMLVIPFRKHIRNGIIHTQSGEKEVYRGIPKLEVSLGWKLS